METYSFSIAEIVWKLLPPRRKVCRRGESLISKIHTKTLIYLRLKSGSINWNGIKIINFVERREMSWAARRGCVQKCLVAAEVCDNKV